MPDDEFTPRERGLLIGNDWAQWARTHGLVARDGEAEIDPVAAAAEEPPRIAEATRRLLFDDETGLRERLDASEDPDAESAFWAGFAHGVRAYLVSIRMGTTDN